MKIHHIGYLVKNLSKSEKQFMACGYEIEKAKKYDPLRLVNIEFLVNGDYRVELIEPADKESPLYPLLKNFKNSPYHICYLTDDLNRQTALLEEQHFALIQPPLEAPCLDGKKVVFLNSTAMGIIELLES